MAPKDQQKADPHPTFSVDTHLFRELGELLVGRDSTALIELVKNSYDADATEVVVYGEMLSSPSRGYIYVRDNGNGMGRKEFEQGFLRIASRSKESGQRRSERLHRRYTGAKGIGRLAAHKLAHVVEVVSFRWSGKKELVASHGVEATIRWDVVERYPTLEKLAGTEAVTVKELTTEPSTAPSTTITLRGLRTSWSKAAHARFLDEIQTFEPSKALIEPIPRSIVSRRLIFDQPVLRDAKAANGDLFEVKLEGDLAPPDAFFQAKVEAATWVIEIEAREGTGQVNYVVSPTKETVADLPDAERQEFNLDHPTPKDGPFFQARILLRTGRAWEARTSGVRVFMEGFRILPYGESRNDWLGLDRDVTERGRGKLLANESPDTLSHLLGRDDGKEGDALLVLPNKHYFGAVFLTQRGGRNLRMLVNREGFVPDSVFETLTTLVRVGIDLATRERAAASEQQREERRRTRAKKRNESDSAPSGSSAPATSALRATVGQAHFSAKEARRLLAAGNVAGAKKKIAETLDYVAGADSISGDIVNELAMIRVLASVGTQMAGFIHEINALVGTAESVDTALRNLNKDSHRAARSSREAKDLALIIRTMADLRRNLERQASYLVDVVTPDARRRRSRLRIAAKFDAGARLIAHVAEARRIQIDNRISADLQSPPMFPAELTTVFSNLLSNAVKAAGDGGRIRATARRRSDSVMLRIENTGTAVNPRKGEHWFRPFESSTTKVDAVLGQGMGLGLPITRSVLAEYGGTISFVEPSSGYRTALEIVLPIQS
jgi:signal transduction histidine kinase